MQWESGEQGPKLNSWSEQKFGPTNAKRQIKPTESFPHLWSALAQGYEEHSLPETRGKPEPAEGQGTCRASPQKWELFYPLPNQHFKAGYVEFFGSRQAAVQFPTSP